MNQNISKQEFQKILDKQKILTQRQSEIMSMYYLDEWTSKQIALELDISVGTIQHTLYLAEVNLRRKGYELPKRKENRGRRKKEKQNETK